MIMSSDSNYVYMNFNAKVDDVLMSTGYDKMSIEDRNSLIAIIANKENMVLNAVTDDYILTYHKKVKCAALDAACNNAIVSGFTSSNGHKYTIDFIDMIDFLAQKMELDDDPTISSVLWKAEDVGDWITHTRDEWLKQVYKEGFLFGRTQRANCQQLKLKVNQATDHPTIVSLTWSTVADTSSSNTSSSSGTAAPTHTVSVSATNKSTSAASATPTIA